MRYLDSVQEVNANAATTAVPGCSNNETDHKLDEVLHHDMTREYAICRAHSGTHG